MSALQAERHPVDRLAEEFVERYRRGERPAIADYIEKYPDLAGELQELLAALVLIEEHGRAHVQPSSSGGRLPDRAAGRGRLDAVARAPTRSLPPLSPAAGVAPAIAAAAAGVRGGPATAPLVARRWRMAA